MWKDCAGRAAEREGVDCECLDVDYAAYRLIQQPGAFDVVVASNVFGDILADLCGVLMGSRGLTHGASFSAAGAAVYQTNHGAAHDLAGADRANPVGQILSLAMMLRESFGLPREAALIEGAVAEVWRQGWRTEDLAGDGRRVAGTRRMGELVAAALQRMPGRASGGETGAPVGRPPARLPEGPRAGAPGRRGGPAGRRPAAGLQGARRCPSSTRI